MIPRISKVKVKRIEIFRQSLCFFERNGKSGLKDTQWKSREVGEKRPEMPREKALQDGFPAAGNYPESEFPADTKAQAAKGKIPLKHIFYSINSSNSFSLPLLKKSLSCSKERLAVRLGNMSCPHKENQG